jgi:DNA-binding response OmpR family regulator
MTPPADPILLIEDDESLRRILSRHLRGLGFAVTEAPSAEAARAALADGPRPGLVLLDLNLPGDTGWDLLRSDAFAARDIPVVITSATAVNPKRLAEFGLAGYLPKPFPLETLVAIVQRVLSEEGTVTNDV